MREKIGKRVRQPQEDWGESQGESQMCRGHQDWEGRGVYPPPSSTSILCPSTVMDIITKNGSGALFILIHLKIGIIYIASLGFLRYPPNILSWNSNSPQLPTLSLSFRCLMNVPLHVFALDSKVLSIQPHLLSLPCFNPFWKLSNVRSHLFFLMLQSVLEALKCKISLLFFFMPFHVGFLLFYSLFVSFKAPIFVKLLQIVNINFNSN